MNLSDLSADNTLMRRPMGDRLHRAADRAVAVSSAGAARQASALFVAAGILGLITDFVPGAGTFHNTESVLVDGFNLVFGIVMLRGLWRRFADRRAIVFGLLALVNLGLSDATGAVPAATLGVWFVLIFLWLGTWFPSGTALALAPAAVATYLIPFAFHADHGTSAPATVVLIVAVSVMVGETMALNATRARNSATELRTAMSALARANLTDDLTGIGNRRLGNQLLDSVEGGDAIVLLDLDHFKRVNDQFGHSRGDELLHDLGTYLRAAMRTADSVTRMGGEEFMIVVRQPATEADVVGLVQRLVDRWREQCPLSTMSAGIAMVQPQDSPASVYTNADTALYDAKQSGRDRVVAARPLASQFA
jgi:diguanylate cyclase (GGDEF)-like protein